MYARHGYTFTTDEWKIFFVSARWYHADSAYSNNMLNATEKANVDTILNYERVQADSREDPAGGYGIAGRAELCQTTGWTNSRVNFVESRPAGGYYVNVMKIDDSDNSYEENYVVTVENGKAIVTGTEQFGEFTPID
ncbi:MAG: YARHG domain-containing protein [Butyricicoccus sp.]